MLSPLIPFRAIESIVVETRHTLSLRSNRQMPVPFCHPKGNNSASMLTMTTILRPTTIKFQGIAQ